MGNTQAENQEDWLAEQIVDIFVFKNKKALAKLQSDIDNVPLIAKEVALKAIAENIKDPEERKKAKENVELICGDTMPETPERLEKGALCIFCSVIGVVVFLFYQLATGMGKNLSRGFPALN